MRLFIAFLLSTVLTAPATAAPSALSAQLEHLSALVSDGYAVGLVEDAQTQTVNAGADDEMLLALFVVEGHGGGNGYVQYLALFTPGRDASDRPWYTLVDFLPVGGKGWQAIEDFAPRVSKPGKDGATRFDFDVKRVAGDDAPNFPSHAATLSLELHNGRLVQLAAH